MSGEGEPDPGIAPRDWNARLKDLARGLGREETRTEFARLLRAIGYREAARLGLRSQDLDEAVQDFVVRVFGLDREHEEPGRRSLLERLIDPSMDNAVAFLEQCLRWRVVERNRRETRRGRHQAEYAASRGVTVPGLDPDVEDGRHRFAAAIEARPAGIDALHRMAFLLRVRDGLAYEEIGRRLTCDGQTAKTWTRGVLARWRSEHAEWADLAEKRVESRDPGGPI